MVLIEAAAASLPAVATDVGGNAEVVLHDRTGILVPSQDPSALAEAMGRVMDMSSASRAAWGEEARRHADAAFHIDRVVERWVALYRRLVNGERP